MEWLRVEVRADDEAARDRVAAALIGLGSGGAQMESGAVTTYLPEPVDRAALHATLGSAAPGAVVTLEPLGEVDWSHRWTTQVGVQRVGRFCVAPPWLAGRCAEGELPIVIDPAMAFGTGEHATTRGVLQLMQDVVREGDLVADLGAGSAILAIAAARLGAGRVAAIESDPDAIGNAEENVARNGVADRVTVIEGDAAVVLPLVAPVRVVLANIISSVLESLSPVMRDALAPGGVAILSGILRSERDAVLAWLARDGWVAGAETGGADAREEWWSVVIRPR